MDESRCLRVFDAQYRRVMYTIYILRVVILHCRLRSRSSGAAAVVTFCFALARPPTTPGPRARENPLSVRHSVHRGRRARVIVCLQRCSEHRDFLGPSRRHRHRRRTLETSTRNRFLKIPPPTAPKCPRVTRVR